MSTSIFSYHSDGANRNAQAVLAILQGLLCDGIEESWNDEFKRYDADIKVARWENCREQGYVISLTAPRWDGSQLNIAFFEHRNSDNICAIKWHQFTLNSPTIDTAEFGDECYSDKFDTSFDVSYDQHYKMADWIHTQLVNHWVENANKELDN
jgi:hypothetical protein